MTEYDAAQRALKYANTFAAAAGVTGLREKSGLPALKKGTVSCLKCSRNFSSEDKTQNRICHTCKRTVEWQEGRESDALYPPIQKNMGYNNPHEVASKARARKGGLVPKKRSLSRDQKQFGKSPLSKKRTRT